MQFPSLKVLASSSSLSVKVLSISNSSLLHQSYDSSALNLVSSSSPTSFCFSHTRVWIANLLSVWDLCNNEIVVRSAKHVIKDLLRDTEDHDLAAAISHFLNCLFGNCHAFGGKLITNLTQSRTPKKEHAGNQSSGKNSKGHARWNDKASLRKTQPSYMNMSSDTLWAEIKEFAVVKYEFELPEDARSRVKKISVIRNLCLKVGITVAARKYDLSSPTPFQTSDVFDLRPVVKHSVPSCSEAKELVETGKLQLAEGMLGEAYTLFSEAFSILQ